MDKGEESSYSEKMDSGTERASRIPKHQPPSQNDHRVHTNAGEELSKSLRPRTRSKSSSSNRFSPIAQVFSYLFVDSTTTSKTPKEQVEHVCHYFDRLYHTLAPQVYSGETTPQPNLLLVPTENELVNSIIRIQL